MQDFFGTKEIYDVNFRATTPLTINGTIFEPNEPILNFNKIQIALLNENKRTYSSKGGFKNEQLIYWEDTTDASFSLSEGVISKKGLAILSNSKLIKNEAEIISCPFSETLESDEQGIVKTKYEIDTSKSFFIYDENGKKITQFELEGNLIQLKQSYKQVEIFYYFNYKNPSEELLIGQRLTNGFLSLDGRLKIKDDMDGHEKTGIIEIPKIKLMSNLSMRLGKDVEPHVYRFNVLGLPVGVKGNKYVGKIIMLDNEIDSDF